MLPKKERLSRDEFNRFFSGGKRIHSPHIQCIYSPNETLHVSVVVSKKTAKTSVMRHKIRRRIYDIVRRHRQSTGLAGVFIFLTKTGISTLQYDALKKEVEQIIMSKK